ncbi:MAG: protein-export chaperone SecB [Rickettsiaceae bacterium]
MNKNDKDLKTQNTPHIAVKAQYIKDLSFENPKSFSGFEPLDQAPEIDLSLDLNSNTLEESGHFEIEITIQATAKHKDSNLFLVELQYAGVFHLINIPEDQQQVVLAVHCPAMIFPFARKIIADVTQEGGFQPLMIDPIDFAALYHKRMTEESEKNNN